MCRSDEMRGGYAAPMFTVTDVIVETGFATSMLDEGPAIDSPGFDRGDEEIFVS